MIKHMALYILARLLSVAAMLFPPLRQAELRLLYKVYVEGPGGFDDAVQMLLMKKRIMYAPAVQKMLASPKPKDKEIGAEFEEFVSKSREPHGAL